MESKVHELEKVVWGVIPVYNYNGVLVEKLRNGYRVFGQTCNTVDEVDEIILNACSSLSESLYKPEKLTVTVSGASNSCQNTESGIIGSPDDLVG